MKRTIKVRFLNGESKEVSVDEVEIIRTRPTMSLLMDS